MIRILNNAVLALVVAFFAGCIHFGETEFPAVSISGLPADKSVKLQVAGFDAMITTYTPVYSTATIVNGSSWYGPHYGHPYATTMTTETLVAQAMPTTVFRDRACEALEKCGVLLRAPDPDYRLEVVFSGPLVSDSDVWSSVGWNVFTIFTADYATQNWIAKLKIHDLKTGRLVFFRDYEQRYEVKVWGPIPIFCPSASSKTKSNAIESWCLTALTDRAIADAVGFFISNNSANEKLQPKQTEKNK